MWLEKPTNEERREIAQKLRSMDERIRKFGVPPGKSSFEFEQAIGLVHIPVVEDSFHSRLADLIEPEPERTCHNLGGDGEMITGEDFTCSECGFWLGYTRIAFAYCPQCGAKVAGGVQRG